MAVSTKIIRNRIKSIKNTKKITKAMEMVSAAKMRRAVENALNTRTYAELALELLVNISKEKQISHPLLLKRKAKKILALVIGSNRGLCGSFNANIGKLVNQFQKENKDKQIEYITVGRKAEHIVKRIKGKVIASFINFSDNLKINEIRGLRKIIIDEFSQKHYDRVILVYTNFVSSLRYLPEIRNLLPISEENIRYMIERLGGVEKEKAKILVKSMAIYLFEPEEESILSTILPKLTEMQIYQALLESLASEHSARMIAMKNASDAAEDMINELTLSFNQLRQAAITKEIAEISAGAAALQ